MSSLLVAWIAAGPPIPVRIVLPGGPLYVGQAIDGRVEVDVGGESLQIEPPKVDGAEIRAGKAGWSRFRIVPSRPGPLRIAPFRARLGDRLGASRPATLEIRDPPPSGRPSSFLGGVGPLTVEAELAPGPVRVGEAIEYQIRLTGPGAIGSTHWPVVASGGPLGLRSDRLGESKEDDPPSRTFRYRLRAANPGESTLPPPAVSTFDPASGRYLTRVGPSRKIRVVEPADFDPSVVPIEAGDRNSGMSAGWAAWLRVAIVVPALVGLIVGLRWALRGRPASPARLLGDGLARLDPADDPASVARAIQAALAVYLARKIGRPAGALTPLEAAVGFEEATGDAEVAGQGADLIDVCDRALYAGGSPASATLIEAARAFQGRLEGLERGARKRRERHP